MIKRHVQHSPRANKMRDCQVLTYISCVKPPMPYFFKFISLIRISGRHVKLWPLSSNSKSILTHKYTPDNEYLSKIHWRVKSSTFLQTTIESYNTLSNTFLAKTLSVDSMPRLESLLHLQQDIWKVKVSSIWWGLQGIGSPVLALSSVVRLHSVEL